MESKDLCAPEVIGVLTDDRDLVSKLYTETIQISFKLREEMDESDSVVFCMKCDEERANTEGTKIWVG